jgi:hypothetical protein
MKEIDWDCKEESIERMRELYPHMKSFMIELCFDIYQQSKTDKALEKEITRIDVKDISLPKIKDFDGYDYSDGGVEVDQNPKPLWKCEKCSVNANMIETRTHAKNTSEGIGGVSKQNEENPSLCDFCAKENENNILDENIDE